jgi:hypothetical protein
MHFHIAIVKVVLVVIEFESAQVAMGMTVCVYLVCYYGNSI